MCQPAQGRPHTSKTERAIGHIRSGLRIYSVLKQPGKIMDKKLVREFRERWQAVAAIEAEEQRAASIDLRWQQLNAILQMAAALGVLPEEQDEEEEMVRRRWVRLKQGRA